MDAFTHTGNHLNPNSNRTINASDDVSTLDPDESVMGMTATAQRRRHDDDDDGSEGLDDDDLESLASVLVGGNTKSHAKVEEEKELPSHACA
jgi:regulator of nonsense transcripts 1